MADNKSNASITCVGVLMGLQEPYSRELPIHPGRFG